MGTEDGIEEILVVNHADDAVERPVVDRQARIAGGCKRVGDFVVRGGLGNGDEIDARRENIRRLAVVKFDGAADQLAFLLVDAAFMLRLFDDGDQLLLGAAFFLLGCKQFGDELFDQGEEEVQRRQKHGNHADNRRGEQSERVGSVLCEAFGRDLSENQDHDCDQDR